MSTIDNASTGQQREAYKALDLLPSSERYSAPGQLPSPHLILLLPFSRASHLLHDLFLALNLDRRLTASQPDELANPPPLLLGPQTRIPGHGTRILERPPARGPLVVEMCQALELRVRQQPEAEESRRERRMDLPCRQLYQRGQAQSHLAELFAEF